MKLRSRSFTLVEVLLVTSLISMVGVAILHAFVNGLKLWTKANRLNRQADVAIFLDKMSDDLNSVMAISGIGFKGMGQQISFPAIVMTQADPLSSRAEEALIDQIGAVQYRLDPASRTIIRRQANYAQALKNKWPIEESTVAANIDKLEFHYNVPSEKGLQLESEVTGKIPLGVMVEVNFKDDSGQHELKRYLTVPLGG